MRILLILLFLFSCVRDQKRELLEDRFFLTWVSATDIKVNKIWKDHGDWFDRPYQAEVLLAEITYLQADRYEEFKDCVYWKVPGRESRDGKLSYITVSPEEECGDQKQEKKILVRDVSKLKFIFTRGEQIELASYGQLKEFNLLIQYQVRSRQAPIRNLLTPLINFKPQKYKNPKVEAERFSSSLTKTVYPGLKINAIGHFMPDGLSLPKKVKWIGNIKDDFASRSLKFCERFNKECKFIETYKCDKCRYGFYEVAGVCADRNDRVCGVSKCGEKGELACPRGNQHVLSKEKSGCQYESTSGFCSKGLVATCLDHKYLVCQ